MGSGSNPLSAGDVACSVLWFATCFVSRSNNNADLRVVAYFTMAKFLGPAQLNNHFQRHGADFAAATPAQYELLANIFLTVPIAAPTLEHTRSLGDLVRFNPSTDHFGTMRGGVIRTFFKPVPCITLAPPQRAIARAMGRCHGYATNTLYYQAACALW
jgi:hypothetical protein